MNYSNYRNKRTRGLIPTLMTDKQKVDHYYALICKAIGAADYTISLAELPDLEATSKATLRLLTELLAHIPARRSNELVAIIGKELRRRVAKQRARIGWKDVLRSER